MLRQRVLRLNWRLALGHVVVNAISLGLTVLILPGISVAPDNRVLILLISGLIFGLLNAFVRPILQFIMFNFLFATFGLVLILINFILLWLLGRFTGEWFQSEGIWWTLLAAVLVGVFGIVLENLLGMTAPVIDGQEPLPENDVEDLVADRLAQLMEPERRSDALQNQESLATELPDETA